MMHWKVERTNNKDLVFEGNCLSRYDNGDDIFTIYKTKEERYILEIIYKPSTASTYREGMIFVNVTDLIEELKILSQNRFNCPFYDGFKELLWGAGLQHLTERKVR